MENINKDTYLKLESELSADKTFKLIVLHGESGSGKTQIVHSVLNKLNMASSDILFSFERFFPFGLLTDEEWLVSDENSILSRCNEMIQNEQCLFFQNMEYCNVDYEKLFHRLFAFYKNTNSKIIAILEYNETNISQHELSQLASAIIEISLENDGVFRNYLKNHFLSHESSDYLFDKIIGLSGGNIHIFNNVLNILQHLEVIHKDHNGILKYRNPDFNIPSDLLTLHVILLDKIERYYKEPLQCAATFSYSIYESVLKDVFREFDNVDKYLCILAQYNSLIKNNDITYQYSDFFHSSFAFSSSFAHQAFLVQLSQAEKNSKLAEYYRYFDKIYNNKQLYCSLKEVDKVLLLCYLTRASKDTININHIKYFTELMSFYYEHFLFNNVIELACRLISSKVLNASQLNKEAHGFWIIYFNALLSTGNYESLLVYKGEFTDDDLNYLIARAAYNNGNPEEALSLLKDITKSGNSTNSINIGYKYTLMASIFDWLGDNKKSKKYFGRALLYCDTDENLKFQLYKKYSQHLDFRMGECRDKMNRATMFYKNRDLKQYAECLHNFGTCCVFVSDYTSAEESLNASINVLRQICSNEIYYPLNSLGILYCYNGSQYNKAIRSWEEALKLNIKESFCELALYNNIFNVLIKMNEYKNAQEQKKFIEERIQEISGSKTATINSALSIQHQIRQFYYNCALLSKETNDFESALNYFVKAKESSTYNSTLNYAIEKNIDEMWNIVHHKTRFIRLGELKRPKPTFIEKAIYENEMYLCEIMYWG